MHENRAMDDRRSYDQRRCPTCDAPLRDRRRKPWPRGQRDRLCRCVLCGKAFVAAGSDERAEAECREHFGPARIEDMEVVCEGCWQEALERMYGEKMTDSE